MCTALLKDLVIHNIGYCDLMPFHLGVLLRNASNFGLLLHISFHSIQLVALVILQVTPSYTAGYS